MYACVCALQDDAVESVRGALARLLGDIAQLEEQRALEARRHVCMLILHTTAETPNPF